MTVSFKNIKSYDKSTGVFASLKSTTKKSIVYLMCYMIALQPVFASGINVAPGGGASIGTPSGSNNVPVLNIGAPTSGGVSHNKFNDFNVDPNGLIINNLNMQNYNPNYKSSISGEHVEFNRNLGTGDAAKVILNEVVGNSVTAMRGQTEIYGQRADYIVANPNGITCAGCGFINTGRLSLITGSANMANGAVDSFNISSTGILRIDGVGVENFGLYAPTHADLVSNAVRIAGEIHANGDVNIYSGNDKFDYKNKVVTSDNNAGVSVAVDSTAIGGIKANNIRIVATQKGFGINTAGNLIADMGNVEITADGDIVVKKILATNNANLKSKSGNVTATGDGTDDGGNIRAQNINVSAGKDFTNKTKNQIVAQNEIDIKTNKDFINEFDGKIIAQNNLKISSVGDINNIGKINAGNNIDLRAYNMNNFGQVMGRNLSFIIDNDLINYRGSGILSGGDITFNIGRDLVNYKADIYALGNIIFQGRDDIVTLPSTLEITSANAAAMAALYDNPYIDAETTIVITPPIIIIPDDTLDELDDVQLKLSDGTILTLPKTALANLINPGDFYTDENGYKIILGAEIITQIDNPEYIRCTADGDCMGDEPTHLPEYSYTGVEDLTVKNPADINQDFAFVEPDDVDDNIDDTNTGNPIPGTEDIPVQNNGAEYKNDNLDEHKSIMDGIIFSDNLMGSLLNWAGRIESGGNMEVNVGQIMNRGFDFNTGKSAATIETIKLRDKGSSRTPKIMWMQALRDTHLDSQSAQIISGGNLTLNGTDILNSSGVISSKGDMFLNATDSIKNQTYSEVVTLNSKWESRKWRGLKGWKYSSYIENADKRIYSAQRSMIVSGGDLKLKSTTLANDQQLDPLAGLGIYVPMPDDLVGGVSVDTRLPVGDNGLFVVRPDGKYLVQTNVSFINPDDFLGSDYFFQGLGDGKSAVDITRIIGDPAYETRLITDAYLKAVGQHWTDNDGVMGSDKDMMKSLYDAARDAGTDMQLTPGIALTANQIANLQQDIIWYVEKEVDGYKVLVPQLYLSQATLDSISGDGKGSKITGIRVLAENEYMVNVGTISADTLLAIDTKVLINESNDELAQLKSGGAVVINADRVENLSASIAGDTVNIKADELINKTKKLTEDRSVSWDSGSKKEHIEIASHTATISGASGVDIELTGKLHNTGAAIFSESGDINIAADEAIFDTLELYNSKEEQARKRMNMGTAKVETIDIKESLKNIGSEINSGRTINIASDKNIYSIGTKFNASNDISLSAGTDISLASAVDYDKEYHYYKKERVNLENIATEIGTAVTGAVAVVVATVATIGTAGALTPVTAGIIAGGVGATAGAVDSLTDADKGKKGTVKESYDYDETLIGNELNAKNITITTGGNLKYGTGSKTNSETETLNVDGKIIFEKEEEKHISEKNEDKFGRNPLTGALRGAGLGVVSGAIVIAGSFAWQTLFTPTACAADNSCTEEDVAKQADDQIKENQEAIDNPNTPQLERERLEEQNRILTDLVIGIETGTIGCTNTVCEGRYDNLYNYAHDENGNTFDPPVVCRDGRCTQLSNGNRIVATPDTDGNYYINGIRVGTDANGSISTYPSTAYISSTGRYDVASFGSVHWSASNGERGGGLADLLGACANSEEGTAARNYYDRYVDIMGTDSNGRPNTNNSDMIGTPDALAGLQELTNEFMQNDEFRNFENAVIRDRYFDTPLRNFSLDFQARINNASNAVQQVLTSTFVQLGGLGNTAIRDGFNLFPDDDISAMIYAVENLSDPGLKGEARANQEIDFLQQSRN